MGFGPGGSVGRVETDSDACGSPAEDEPGRAAECQRPLALFRFRRIDVAAPVAQLDPDAALFEIDALVLEAGDFGDSGTGSEAGLTDQQVRIFQTRQDTHGLIFSKDAFLVHAPFFAPPRRRMVTEGGLLSQFAGTESVLSS